MTKLRNTLRGALLFAVLMLSALPTWAQTSLNSTTLSAAVSSLSAQTIPLASVANVAVGDLLFVDREAMQVNTVATGVVTVRRGVEGTASSTHASGALVYTGARNRFYTSVGRGSCTRTAEAFLPRIVLPVGDVMDCPVGAQVWTLLNAPATHTSRSEAFNLDNGAGTTIDALLIRPARAIYITACRIVYEDATTGTVAGGTASVGTTVGGVQIVAATNYENTKAVGTTTAMTVVAGAVAAGTPVLVRHTGVAVTQAGESVVECDWHYR
jgi:hypothetical protein